MGFTSGTPSRRCDREVRLENFMSLRRSVVLAEPIGRQGHNRRRRQRAFGRLEFAGSRRFIRERICRLKLQLLTLLAVLRDGLAVLCELLPLYLIDRLQS